jgi:class 3 adenylate cyclase/tetratricopeptide (TPR) repeat protein
MSAPECAACGFSNRPGALFCGRCGVQLGQSCPACGEVVAAGLAYCTACGAELAQTAAHPIAEERKVVTVLFADLVGFTGRAEQLDPEEVRGLLSPFHARVKSELERYGGTVEKFIGDAVVALFGAPLAHEDDPERAVRSALAVREAIGELNVADPALDLRLRIGITTGEAMITLRARPSAGEGMAAGDVVNTAARLETAAAPGAILVDEATWRATDRTIEYRKVKPVRAKGKAEPIEAWEVVGPRARLGVDIAFRGGAELVGRREELDLLRDALMRAERERSTQLVTLVGVPGIGKSRLLFELYNALHSDATVFVSWRQGRSLPYGEGVSFWALGEMVKAQAGILESDDAGIAEDKLLLAVTALLPEAAEARWVLGHLRPLVGLGEAHLSAAGRETAFAAWRRFWEALAEQRPLVLVFEDVHWADDGLLDFVDHLADWTTGVPLLVLCTARPELLERRPSWGGGKRNALTISLSPLSDSETTDLLRSLGSSVQERLLAHAGGNPLYAEEFARMLAQGAADGEIPLPDSVQGIIAARLDTLPPDEKAVLHGAAVVGKVFWVGALTAVAGLERATVEERLRALERKEFVRRERRSSVAGEAAYVFRHALLKEVAYSQIPRWRRSETHRLAADWIDSLASGRAEDLADLVAHHLGSALEFARATGQEAPELAARARLAYRHAGDRAAGLNAPDAAARFYQAALELWPEDDDERPYVLLRRGRALLHAEARGSDVLTEAVEALLDLGDREAAAESEVMLGELEWLQGRHESAFRHFEDAVLLLADAPASHAKTYVLSNLARFLTNADEAEAAIRVGFEALQMAEELDLDEFRAHALTSIGFSRAQIGDLGGLVDLERSVAIAQQAGSPVVVRGYNNLASVTADLGNLSRAFELYASARREAERFGEGIALRWLAVERMHERYWTGGWDDALRDATELLAEREEGLPSIRDVDAFVVRGRIRLARGDTAGSVADAAAALEIARAAKEPQMLFPALAFSSRTLFESSHRDDAVALADELLSEWSGSSATVASFWTADLATVLATLDRGSDLIEVAEGVRAKTRWLEAATAYVGGEFERAAQLYAQIGSLPDEAHAHLQAAAGWVEAGLRADADRELAQALAFFRRVRADAYVGAAEALLAASA